MSDSFETRIDRALLGSFFNLRRANRVLQEKIDNRRIEQFKNDRRLRCATNDIQTELTRSINRLERVETKAMGTLLGVAVAIAVFGATSGILGSDGMLACKGCAIRIASAVLLVFALLYLFASGLLALGAYEIGQVYRPNLGDRRPVVDKKQEKIVLLYCIQQNQDAGTMRSNRLSASFTCLRNGIVAVLTLGVLVIVAGVLL